jgi:hypothetical protein
MKTSHGRISVRKHQANVSAIANARKRTEIASVITVVCRPSLSQATSERICPADRYSTALGRTVHFMMHSGAGQRGADIRGLAELY